MQKANFKESILLYNIKGKPYASKLKAILLRQGIRIKVIEPSQYNIAICDLLSGKPQECDSNTPANTVSFEDEMLVMAGLTNARLDQFLFELRKQGIRIPLKAIVTPHNSTWTSIQLHEELVEEHNKMQELNNSNK